MVRMKGDGEYVKVFRSIIFDVVVSMLGEERHLRYKQVPMSYNKETRWG